MGIFRSEQGVDYSLYRAGLATGVGVGGSADFTRAHHLLDGHVAGDVALDEAEELARSKFNLPAPGPREAPGRAAGSGNGLVRFFMPSTPLPDGKPRFKDHGKLSPQR